MVDAQSFAQDWIAAWNSRDLEEILSHYSEDVVFHSPYAAKVTGDGLVTGKAALRSYWRVGLAANPDLRFTREAILGGQEALTIVYRNQRGVQVAETFAFNAEGKVRESFACYGK